MEQGNIFFFYKPKKGIKSVRDFDDIGRFYLVLKPDKTQKLRFIIMGTKRMPSTRETERGWGMVTKVGGRGFKTEKPVKQIRPSGARPTGEGVYALVKHLAHTHLVYYLELPQRLGEVQKKLQIARQGNYVVTIKSPQIPTPPDANLPPLTRRSMPMPSNVTEQFKGRKYMTVHTPGLLDNEGSTLFVVGVNSTARDNMGLSIDKSKETEVTADIFNTLKMNKSLHPTKPLLEGTWE